MARTVTVAASDLRAGDTIVETGGKQRLVRSRSARPGWTPNQVTVETVDDGVLSYRPAEPVVILADRELTVRIPTTAGVDGATVTLAPVLSYQKAAPVATARLSPTEALALARSLVEAAMTALGIDGDGSG